ncbi:MAG: hypothetical protein WB987_11880 [Candidatus Acidiferrales bacterium]
MTSHTDLVREVTARARIGRAVAVLLGSLILAWPAFFNRYPLLYPDSMTYLADGRLVARALFLHQLSDYYGIRSLIYSLGILPFHWNITPWPVVAIQAFLTGYVFWLVVRSILPRRTVLWYLAVVTLLSLLTSVAWFASLIMPDFLGPVLYLCIYLLIFARDSLTRRERVGVGLIAWLAATSHATHLMLAAGLCVFAAVLSMVFRRERRPQHLKAVGQVALVILLAATAQVALHAYLYGAPSLYGDRPPFLMARVIADGPGQRYLEQHCGEVKFVICGRLRDLPESPDEFIWGATGIWQTSSEDDRKRMQDEEVSFALATLRAFPRAQLTKSAANFWEQLTTFDIALDANDWVLEEFDRVLPGGKPSYLKSRQVHNDLPFDFFTAVLNWTVVASLALIAVCTVLLWRRRPPRVLGLAIIIVPAVIANALVTGALSMVEDRYQSRVIWLIPLLGILSLMEWVAHRQRTAQSVGPRYAATPLQQEQALVTSGDALSSNSLPVRRVFRRPV